MREFKPPDANFEARVRASFSAQPLMRTLSARIIKVAPGEVHIELPFSAALTQQDGFIHAGVITSIVDSACGYAAFSLMPAGASVLTVEFKVNLLNPARGERFVAIGKVIKPGRTLAVCGGEVNAYANGDAKPVAMMQATMMQLSK
jgi:uncharacterized protein (TIGR00369 family)